MAFELGSACTSGLSGTLNLAERGGVGNTPRTRPSPRGTGTETETGIETGKGKETGTGAGAGTGTGTGTEAETELSLSTLGRLLWEAAAKSDRVGTVYGWNGSLRSRARGLYSEPSDEDSLLSLFLFLFLFLSLSLALTLALA